MNYKMLSKLFSQILALECVFMAPSIIICLLDNEIGLAINFFISIVIILAVAGILKFLSKNAKKGFYAREGYVCAGGSWILLSLGGALPFFLSRQIPNYIDAWFEIVSGLTTTGASILEDVESMSRGLLFWRSFSHWIGGMGVLVLLLALVSMGKNNNGFTLHLLRAESPGPDVGRIVPKMRETAMILYIIYLIMTLVDFLFLIAGGMSCFEALCTAFGTAGTGGFGVKADSLGSYSPYLINVTTIFMFLFGVNFNLYYLITTKQFKTAIKDEEVRYYFGIAGVATVLIAINIRNLYPTIGETLKHSAFQVSSLMTSTGFSTVDFDLWPNFSKGVLLFLMLIGACAGSTGGGFKVIRFILLFKSGRRGLKQMLSPNKVAVIRMNGHQVNEKVMNTLNIYLTVYVLILLASIFVVSFDGQSILTNISAVLACFNNIGPGFDMVGPSKSFHDFSILSKLVLIFDMLAGRLEIMPILAICNLSTWKRK
ncbi:MAG: TrkH family potassium uptake protein [Lachnospiraceae bacterium]|nr:TrkH family potassium uptake protein [Lachnospiraceae bacterium]